MQATALSSVAGAQQSVAAGANAFRQHVTHLGAMCGSLSKLVQLSHATAAAVASASALGPAVSATEPAKATLGSASGPNQIPPTAAGLVAATGSAPSACIKDTDIIVIDD